MKGKMLKTIVLVILITIVITGGANASGSNEIPWAGPTTLPDYIGAPAKAQGGITGISPAEGTVGTQVTISGSGFGEKQGEVLIGEEKCKVQAWSDSQITCEVHKPQASGDYPLTVLRQGDKKPAEPLTFSYFTMQRPKIFPGELAQDGVTVTVLGEFFGDKKGEIRVGYLEGGAGGEVVIADPKIVDWSMEAIRFEIPAGLVGKFVLKVGNQVGGDFALLDLGGGTPLLGELQDPAGWGGFRARNNGSGVWFKGNFYVFYLNNPSWFYDHPIVRCRIFTPATGSFDNCPGTLPTMYTEAIPVSLVVGDELWLFHVTGSRTILYSRYDGSDWLSIPYEGTVSKTPKILWYTTDKMNFHPAVVYNPVTGRVTMYHTYETHVVWSYTDDGETWHHGGDIYNYSAGGLSAVYHEGVITGSPYDTLLLFHDNVGQKFVYYLKDGVRVYQWMTTEGHSHALVDLDDNPSGKIAMIYKRYEGDGLTGEDKAYVRELANPGWRLPELVFTFPDLGSGMGRYLFSNTDLTGAISLWPDGTRRLMLFYCYDISAWYADDDDYTGPWWRMADIGIW
jgi:hypothetical protein